ncbi:4-azaleucine resistance transporter AzlC [Labedella gwakjiensis]|uniref:4-azaleucine resistance transporter AzlC n=1 Tax=Labedella gwakjiensis TaxID=390269 RepID=A0A2P8GVN4_9MICO|nr:AzlC family ABC transporter permease [Labedella gwakjiensis]PSL38031.1 4-azaleucine resistance transporter AzlC [Labedella gwakjiensis]RUQ87408.1 branched-chain amino acid ABC transporter permease [Labedella gwakjiensis]
MRSPWRTIDRSTVRSILVVCLADGLVGLAFGAIAVGADLPLWLPVLLSIVVFAGASQFLLVGVIASGGSLIAAVAAGLLVNARLLPLGVAVGDAVGRGRWRTLLGSHLLTDESVAFALIEPRGDRRRAAFWFCGVALFVCWNVGVVIGALVGTLIPDTEALGLDAAFPAILLALVLPSLRSQRARRAAAVGVAIALATAPFLPAGLPVLLALLGVLVSLPRRPVTAPPVDAGAARRGTEEPS